MLVADLGFGALLLGVEHRKDQGVGLIQKNGILRERVVVALDDVIRVAAGILEHDGNGSEVELAREQLWFVASRYAVINDADLVLHKAGQDGADPLEPPRYGANPLVDRRAHEVALDVVRVDEVDATRVEDGGGGRRHRAREQDCDDEVERVRGEGAGAAHSGLLSVRRAELPRR